MKESFFDYRFSKTFSVKLRPVLGFLNTEVENEIPKLWNVVYWGGGGFNGPQAPFFYFLIDRMNILSNILIMKNINEHARGALDAPAVNSQLINDVIFLISQYEGRLP